MTVRSVATVLLVALAVVVFGNSWGTAVTDVKPEVYFAPGRMLRDYIDAWSGSPYLGNANFNVGLSPVVGLLAPGAALGLSPEILYKLFHLVLWALAGLGASRALRELAPSATSWAGLGAAVLYVANPYAVVGGSTLAILLPYAFLPWLVVALVRSLREPRSWVWPAAFGLAFFAMSGMNVGVVPIFELLVVPPVALVVGRAAGHSWWTIGGVLARCALFVVGVSLYWLIPAWSATSTGLQVTAESESIEGIAQVSSLVEVLRGMGMWSVYGSGPDGPWQPAFAPYLANPLVVMVTLAWPVAALLSLTVAPAVLRRTAAWTIGVGAIVLVGFFPGTVSTLLAAIVERAFDAVPPLVAFRTTNKAGAVVALCFALLIGNALPDQYLRLRRRGLPAMTRVATAAALSTVGVWVMPALSGNLYTSPIDVPGYWREAAAGVDAAGDQTRVLFLPGQVRPSYRWTGERVDDLSNSLMDREAIIPYSSPNASAPGANFLAALGDLVASGGAGASTVSVMATYAGAGDVLLRHDLRWEDNNGARPQSTATLLGADPGLLGVANYGRPGENVASPAGTSAFEQALPPLQQYRVAGALATVSARALSDSVTVAGDAWSFDSLARSGHAVQAPVVWFAHDLDRHDLLERLGPSHRLLITDTNRRRAAIPNRLTAGYGPLLGADSAEPSPTRVLGEPDDQTVLRRTGPTITASQVGSAFYDLPYGQPDNVLDGDDSTSWLFGDFDRAPGTTLQVGWSTPQTLGRISIRPVALGGVHLDSVTLTAGDTTRRVRLPDSGVAVVDLGGVVSDELTLRVDSTRGDGFSLVGIAELGLPGDGVQRVARTPLTLTRLYADLGPRETRDFDRTPLDVSLTREVNGPDPADDSETQLSRDVVLPTRQRFLASAELRMVDRSEGAFDRLAGLTTAVSATSSGSLFDNPDLRASMASDDNPGTAWVPGGDVRGAWWQIESRRRPLDSIVVEQRPSTAGDRTRIATRVRVEVDGKGVTTATLGPGRTVIDLPRGVVGRTVRLVILRERGPSGVLPPQFTTIDTGAVTTSSDQPTCTAVAELDGDPLRMRPVDLGAVFRSGGAPTAWVGCSPLRLGPGEHQVRPSEGWVLDRLDLTDRRAARPAADAGVDLVSKVEGRDVDQRITLRASEVPVALRTGQSWDPRWRATLDGEDLGPPVKVDGWSTGWVLPAGKARTVHVQFAPQRAASWGLAVSALAVGCAGVLWLWGCRRRRSGTGPRSLAAPPEDADDTLSRPPGRVVALVAVAATGLAFGLPGLVGLATAVVLATVMALRPVARVRVGAAFVALAGAVQVLTTHESWWRVDAGVPSATMWPHWLAVVGVVVALVSTLVPMTPVGRRGRSRW